MTPWGRILSVFLAIGLTFVGAQAAGIDIHGKPIELMLSTMTGIPLLLLPSLSQRWRTVGANCIPISRIGQKVRSERVRVPLFTYISPLGLVTVLAFFGLVFVAVIVAGTEIEKLSSLRDEAIERILFEVLFFVILTIVFLIYRRFRRTAEEVIAIVSSPPIVLLRSFVGRPAMRVAEGKGVSKRTFEQLVALQLRPYGPFVGIGRPGEALPQPGAARTYTSDAEWQEKALPMMAASRRIAFIVGATCRPVARRARRWAIAGSDVGARAR